MAAIAAATAPASLGVSGRSRSSWSSAVKVYALFSKKSAASAPKAKAVAAAPLDEKLAKWYGPDKRIYLPEGLLDRSEVPEYLNGEILGDYGYDPFGLSKKSEDFVKYQAYELIHARWAMLGAAGFIIPEAFNKFGANCGPKAVWFKVSLLLEIVLNSVEMEPGTRVASQTGVVLSDELSIVLDRGYSQCLYLCTQLVAPLK